MKIRMDKDKWEKIVSFENREFRIRFWYDSWDLFYTSIEEKVPTHFNRKGYFYRELERYWIDETKQNPIEVVLAEIKKYLKTEKELKKLEEELDKFCQ